MEFNVFEGVWVFGENDLIVFFFCFLIKFIELMFRFIKWFS